MFHIAVPLTLCGYMWDPAGVRIFNRLLRREKVSAELAELAKLIAAAASGPANAAPENYVKVQSAFSLNHRFFERTREEDIPRSIASMCLHLAGLRFRLLQACGWRGLAAFDHQVAMLRDVLRAAALRGLAGGVRLRESRLWAWLTGASACPAQASTPAPLAAPEPASGLEPS
jgi:hypothetical protein